MRVLPVLDVRGGEVVRGIAGRRREYRPIVSRLVSSACPLKVAEAFRDHFGRTHLYLADLDAIAGAAPALPIFRDLHARGFRLWVDAGVRDATGAAVLAAAGVAGIVVGLETVQGPTALEQIVNRFGAERVIFSLDLKNGTALGDVASWKTSDVETIADQAARVGPRHLIVLDLARVGTGVGTGTEELCRRLATAHPQVEIAAGGGIRNTNDLQRLARIGTRTVLIASALHDGRLSRQDLEKYEREQR